MKRIIKMKRLCAFLLVAALILTAFPVSVWAAGEPQVDDEGVYQIGTAVELMWFAEQVNAGKTDMNGELTAHIDVSAEEWIPIGVEDCYSGTFDGNGFTVTLSITADDTCEYPYIGLFGCLYKAVVKNICVDGGITITEENECGPYVGGIAGYAYKSSIIKCKSMISFDIAAELEAAGGIVGYIEDNGEISYCANRGDVSAASTYAVGGIAGTIENGSAKMSYCYNRGSIEAMDCAGGLAGSGDVKITACYSSAATEDWGAPKGLNPTGTITSETCYGELAGILYDTSVSYSLCYTEKLDGGESFFVSDCEGCAVFCSFSSVSAIVDFFEEAGNEAAYTLAEENSGDGWPVLAWELIEPKSPEEQREAERIAAAKADAKTAIELQYETNSKEIAEHINGLEMKGYMYYLIIDRKAEMEAAKTTLLEQRNQAAAAVETCKSVEEAVAVKTSALTNMQKTADDTIPPETMENGVPKEDKWDGKTITQPDGLGTKEEPYRISKGAELAWFSEKVNESAGQKKKSTLCAVLTADIDLSGHEFIPIACKAHVNEAYAGTFDGQNHIIHNLCVNAAAEIGARWDYTCGGLFGTLNAGAVVKNVKVAGVISLANGDTHGNSVQNNAIGGIAGKSYGLIYNCLSSVVLTNGNRKDYNASQNSVDYIGGIVGIQNSGTIEKCVSHVLIRERSGGKIGSYVGGIVGLSYSGTKSSSFVRYCRNYGTIYGTGTAGGIVGMLDGSAQVRECENYGSITGKSRVGGIAGAVGDSDGYRESVETTSAGMTYVYNAGSVIDNSTEGENTIGGIAGYMNTSGSISYAYNDSKNIGTDKAGGLVGSFQEGIVSHGESTAENRLWGTAASQGAYSEDTLKVSAVTGYQDTAASDEVLALRKMEATQELLKSVKAASDKVYGTQNTAYNEVVLTYIRKIELAAAVSDVNRLADESKTALTQILSQLALDKETLVTELETFVKERVYDEQGSDEIAVLLAEAKEAVLASADLDALSKVSAAYLGTDTEAGRLEKECDTYNTKAKTELYNEILYDKKYSLEDMAVLLSVYDVWAEKLDRAESVEAVDAVFADARYALKKCTADMTEGSTAPDMTQAAHHALKLEKENAGKVLEELAEDYKTKLEDLYQDGTKDKEYTAVFIKVLEKTLNYSKEKLDATKKIADNTEFKNAATYAEAAAVRFETEVSLRKLYETGAKRISVFLKKAEEALDKVWDGETKLQPEEGTGEVAAPYQIGTGAELAWFAENAEKSDCAVLTADIDLGYNEWTPVKNGWQGCLDGAGHTIKGMYISTADKNTGFFGKTDAGAEIKNLVVEGLIELTSLSKSGCIGGLTGSMQGTLIQNCTVNVEIRLENHNYSSKNSFVGGIAGLAAGEENHIQGTCFKGSIEVPGNASYQMQGIGGIVGKAEGALELYRTVNKGTVTIAAGTGIGGIIGYADASGKAVTVKECANQGTISADANGILEKSGGTGGIIGIAEKGRITVEDSYHTGTLIGSKIVGGIIGGESNWNSGSASKKGNSELVVKNCYSAGSLVVPNNQMANKIGAVAGYPLDGCYKDDLSMLKGSAQAAMGWRNSIGDRISSVIAENLKKVFTENAEIIESIAGLNHGYPIFSWQLTDTDNRQAVVDYMENYYEENIRDFATEAQCSKIQTTIKEQSRIIATAENTTDILDAFAVVMEAMDTDVLLEEAKQTAVMKLEEKISGYLSRNKALTDEITALSEAKKGEIQKVQKPSDLDVLLDQTDAAVVDLLISDIGEITDGMSKENAETAKKKIALAEQAYNSLNAEQKAQVESFLTLAEAKAAMASYEKAQADKKQEAEDQKNNAVSGSTAESGNKSDAENAVKPEDTNMEPDDITEDGVKPEDTNVEPDDITKPDDITEGASEPEDTAKPDDTDHTDTSAPKQSFDWSIVWIILGIAAAALAGFGMVRWFMAAKRRKRK